MKLGLQIPRLAPDHYSRPPAERIQIFNRIIEMLSTNSGMSITQNTKSEKKLKQVIDFLFTTGNIDMNDALFDIDLNESPLYLDMEA